MDRKIERSLDNGMTVEDLKAILEDMDPESIVLFTCDYGDYHHTAQALPVEGVEEKEAFILYESAYSRSGIALRKEDDDEGEEEDKPKIKDEDDKPRRIVVLS